MMRMVTVTEQTPGRRCEMIYYYWMDPPLCSGGPPPHTRFALPATREKRLSVPEIGEKEREYLFKELYKLKSNYLMSTLRSQSPLECPQMHSPSFCLCPVWGMYLRKRNRSPPFFSSQASWSQNDAAWLLCLGLNPSASLPLPHHFRLLPQLVSAASIGVFFQPYWAAKVSPGRCGPVVWSQPSPSSQAGSVTRGSCLPVTSWVEVTPIPLAQSMATAI